MSKLYNPLIVVCLALVAASFPSPVFATNNTNTGGGGGTVAPQTCDTRVWQTMENRARLETEREIMQNQNLIFKGDSVLNYTCFDSFASHVTSTVGVLFTHTTYWDSKEIIQWGAPYGMDTAMNNVVINSLKTYTTGNYNHNLLGGRGSELGLTQPTVQNIPGRGGTYACGTMAQVWSVAKCMNFMQTDNFAKNDGFYPFKNLAPGPNGGSSIEGYEQKNDVRQYPSPCSGGTPVPSGWAKFTNYSRNAQDDGVTYNKYYPYSDVNGEAFTAVRKMVDPVGGQDGASDCGPAVKTGVKILFGGTNGGGSGTDDAVCTNPGCTYNGTQCSQSTSGGGA